MEAAGASMHDAIDNVASSAKPALDRMSAGAHQTVEKVAIAASDLAESLGVKADELKDLQDRLTEECRRYVRDNPLASVGIALAAGFLLSRLLSSR
ncbi:MAG: DUF883 C-terminal domain-containing protein [Betaproteobacteria bacterium]